MRFVYPKLFVKIDKQTKKQTKQRQKQNKTKQKTNTNETKQKPKQESSCLLILKSILFRWFSVSNSMMLKCNMLITKSSWSNKMFCSMSLCHIIMCNGSFKIKFQIGGYLTKFHLLKLLSPLYWKNIIDWLSWRKFPE